MAIARHKTRQREQRDERALTRRAKRGDRKAFELLYASYEGRLYRFCYRLTGSSVSAAALVEATFTRALADLPEDGLDTLDVAGHLYGTARTLAYERHTNGGPPEADGGGERVREVGTANRRLAPRQRMTLALRDLEGRPDDEIASALGADEAAVAALVARARLRLRSELRLPAAFAACDARLPELSAYSDGTLPAERRDDLEAHVEGCADCRAALFALREAKLRYRSLPVPRPPGELSSRMAVALDAVGLAALRPPGVPAADGGAATGGRQTAAAAAMAALVIAGTGVTIAAWRHDSGGEPSRAPAPARAHATAAAGAGSVSSQTAGGSRSLAAVVAAAPPELHHLRSGARRVGHVAGPPRNAAAIAVSAPAGAAPSADPPAGAAPRAAPPEPPAPIPVEILPPAVPPSTPAPADASPAPPEPPPPSQTTST